jgi:subtilisin family serine protease
MRRVIGVGSTNVRNEISSYSSVGPSSEGRLKPELSAPGEDVRSSVPGSTDSYDTYSGTSMACPHVAGVTALVMAANPGMTFGQVRQALLDGSDHDTTSQGKTCGSVNDSAFPNHHFGFGIVNAVQVLESAKRIMGK